MWRKLTGTPDYSTKSGEGIPQTHVRKERLDRMPDVSSGDTTLVDEKNPRKGDQVIIDDWSHTGRGSHIDFGDDEIVPLKQGKTALHLEAKG